LSRFKKTKPEPPKTFNGLQTIKGQFSLTTDDDIDTLLTGARANQIYLKMANTDPICGAVLFALIEIFQNIEWKVYDDNEGILQASMDAINWKDQLTDILSSLIFGHSVMETTIEKDADGRVLWSGMYFRPQTTLTDWIHDAKGKLQYIEQTVDGTPVEIKAQKCLVFHACKSQANPLGKSLFRNAHRDWHYKSNIEQIEAIGVERDLTGLPILTAPEGETLMDAKGNLNALGVWAWKVVRSVKRNTQEGLVLPDGWTFDLVGSPGKRQFDLNDVINRYSNNIALSMLSQFLVLGVTNSSGSFALAKEQASLFHLAVEGIANSVANVVNTQFIGSPALQLYNNLDKRPFIKPVGIERVELNDMASFLGRLLKFNVITPDDKLEEFLRDRVALPPRDAKSSRIADVKLANENPDTPEGEGDE